MQSGVSSRRLIDVVIADGKGCTITALILAQMFARPRDEDTEVIVVVTDPSIVRPPGGSWIHERVDYDDASNGVRQHCRERALSDAATVTRAEAVLRMALLRRAYGDRVGNVTVGVDDAPTRVVPTDDDAFYARVTNNKGVTSWLRFVRKPYETGMTLAEAVKHDCKSERMSLAARSNQFARVSQLAAAIDTVGWERESLLKHVAAYSTMDRKNNRRDFLRKLDALVRREARAYDGMTLYELTPDEEASMNDIQKARAAMQMDDVVQYANYEKFVFRTSDKRERYEKHYFAIMKEFKTYSAPARSLFDAKRARLTLEEDAQEDGEAREVDEPEHGEESPFADDEDLTETFENAACFADAPRLAFENSLTYGTAIVGDIVDDFLDAYERYMDAQRTGADPTVAPKELKDLRKLMVFMAKRESRYAFMALYDIRHSADADINSEALERTLEMKGRGTDSALQKWLVLHDTLIAVGFPGGIFDDGAKVRELFKKGTSWDEPENQVRGLRRSPQLCEAQLTDASPFLGYGGGRPHQAARERTLKVIRSLQGLDDKSRRVMSAQKASLKDFNKIIKRCVFDNAPSSDFFDFELVHGVDAAKQEFWAVRRTGVFWEYLDMCPPPEWNAFFKGDWVNRKGVYASAADDEPLEPRM